MAGGGTGGHVIPAIAVARELRRNAATAVRSSSERSAAWKSRLVPQAGFPLEFIRVGGVLKVIGPLEAEAHSACAQLLTGTARQSRRFEPSIAPTPVFSMGGYVAGPPVLCRHSSQASLIVVDGAQRRPRLYESIVPRAGFAAH